MSHSDRDTMAILDSYATSRQLRDRQRAEWFRRIVHYIRSNPEETVSDVARSFGTTPHTIKRALREAEHAEGHRAEGS